MLQSVCRSLIATLVSNEQAFSVQCRTKQSKLEGSYLLSQVSVYRKSRVMYYLSASNLPGINLPKTSGQPILQKYLIQKNVSIDDLIPNLNLYWLSDFRIGFLSTEVCMFDL